MGSGCWGGCWWCVDQSILYIHAIHTIRVHAPRQRPIPKTQNNNPHPPTHNPNTNPNTQKKKKPNQVGGIPGGPKDWEWFHPEVVGPAPAPRTGHAACLLGDGKTILVQGGWDPQGDETLVRVGEWGGLWMGVGGWVGRWVGG